MTLSVIGVKYFCKCGLVTVGFLKSKPFSRRKNLKI